MSPFANYLSQLTEPRGAAAELARNSDIDPSQMTRFAKGATLPGPEVYAKIAAALPLDERNALTVAYLLSCRPDNTPAVKVIIAGQEGSLKDRLTLVCETLSARTREDLATVLESVGKAPESAALWIRSMADIFAPSDTLALAAETPQQPPVTPPRQEVVYPKPTRKK